MQNLTKYALEDSLKKLLLKKPLDKITINDLTSDCGISRMAFYYHFKDIYDLVEWACIEDAARALQGKKTYATWQEGILQIFEVVQENKPFILNVYRCVSREQIENYLFSLTYSLIAGVVEEQAEGMDVPKEEREVHRSFLQVQLCRCHAGLDPSWNEGGTKRAGRKNLYHHAWKYHPFPGKCRGCGKGRTENFSIRKRIHRKRWVCFFREKTGNTLQTGRIVKKFIILQTLLIEDGKRLR